MENLTSHTHRISNNGNVFTDVTLAYDDDTRFNAHNLISVSVMVISVGSGQYYLHSQEQLSERVFSSVSTGQLILIQDLKLAVGANLYSSEHSQLQKNYVLLA